MRNRRARRTRPTVKPLATMNRKNADKWEMRLGLPTTVVLLGLVLGSMVVAFFIGHYAGQSLGFDRAMEDSIAQAVRLPIDTASLDEEVSEEMVSEVYAKLNDTTSSERGGRRKRDATEKPVPKLGSIQRTEDAPLILDTTTEEVSTDDVGQDALEQGEPEQDTQLAEGIKILGEEVDLNSAGTRDSTTLGSLIAKPKSDSANPGADSSEMALKDQLKREAGELSKRQARVVEEKTRVGDTTRSFDGVKLLGESEAGRVVVAEKPKPKFLNEEPSARDPKTTQRQPADSGGNNQKTSVVRLKPSTQKSSGPRGSERGVRDKIPTGWYAQVAAPRDYNDATALVSKLRGSGFGVMIEGARVRGQDYYRVLVGPETARKHAERLLLQLKREKYLQGEPFIKKVK